MRRFRTFTILSCQLLGLLVSVPALAIASSAPKQDYESIRQRNVFGLREPAQPLPPTNPPTQVPKITLTGITTVTGGPRALLQAMVPGAKPGEAAKPEYMVMAEGQREGNIEVLQIDPKAELVKINDYGEIVTLSFEKDAKPATTGAVTATPRTSIPVPKVTPGVGNLGALRPGYRALPARIPRTSTRASASGSSTADPTANPVVPVPSATGAETPYPPPPPTAATANETPNAEGQTQLSPEDELLLEELEQSATPQSPTTAPGTAPGTLPPSAGALPPGLGTQRTKPPLLPQ